MKIMLTKLTAISSYADWLNVTVNSLTLSRELSNELLTQLQQRDQLGSVQIAEHVIMPHVVNRNLPESWLIISQLARPVKYVTTDDITTGIYIFSRPEDSSISNAIDHLTDESVINALQDPQLSKQRLEELLAR